MEPMERLVVARVGNRNGTDGFQGIDTVLCGILMVHMCDYTFVQTHSPYDTGSEPLSQMSLSSGGADTG